MAKIKSGKPVVLVFGGHDPSGCAGIHADIEAIAAQGCHAATVITVFTTQTWDRCHGYRASHVPEVKAQARLLMESLDVRAIKIGVIGTLELLCAILECVNDHPGLPIVLDPVLSTTSGVAMASDEMIQHLVKELIPRTEIMTPNTREAGLLTGINNDGEGAARQLTHWGCRHVLLTGTHDETDAVINTHYSGDARPVSYEVQRLPGEYRGSGCLLASAIAANRALGNETGDAIAAALDYTTRCLQAVNSGDDRVYIPDRIRWKLRD